MRKLFMSDIHGCYNEMLAVLRYANYDPAVDQLVVGGDMIDRGPDSALVLKEVKCLQENYPQNVRVIAGNHEDMMIDYFTKDNPMWLGFAEEAIVSIRRDLPEAEFEEMLAWLIALPETVSDDAFVYVHAGINPFRKEQLREEMLWMPYDTTTKMRFNEFDRDAVLQAAGGRKVVHGHTPKSHVFDDGARICADLGAGVKSDGKLALVDLTNGLVYSHDFRDKSLNQSQISQNKSTLNPLATG